MTYAVITGVGSVSPGGSGIGAIRTALEEGQQPLAAVDHSSGFRLRGAARLAGLLGANPYAPWLSPRDARRMSPASRMAVCSSLMAADAARLTVDQLAGEETAVSLGTAFCSSSYTSSLMNQLHEQGPTSISPLLFMETVANAHAGQIALACGCTGANSTLVQGEASGLLAVARGAQMIRSHRARRVLTGAVEEVSPTLHGFLGRHGALARQIEGDDGEHARVFDARRNGTVIAEGGTVFVIESENDASDRGAPVLAKIVATARANDPTAPVADWGTGHAELGRRLSAALGSQGVDLSSIDLVVSGANGSRKGDRLEALTLRAAFGDELPVVVAPKSVVGEYAGGFLASAVLALEGGAWAPTPGFEQVDTELGLTPYLGPELPASKRVLVTALAAGGAACWIVLERGAGS